jgi:putative ABC transport system permease protein
MSASRIICRLLLLGYPRAVRTRLAADLEAAFAACVERERARFGMAGRWYAWTRIACDSVVAAVAMRLDERRARRIASAHTLHGFSKETGMKRVWQDLKYAGRGMYRAPAFSATVVLTLGLAIGATTAVFSAVNAVLLRALPYREPGRLVMAYEGISKAFATPIGFSPPDYVAFAERAAFFDSVAAFRNREYELSGVEPPERITGARVSASLFGTLGVTPAVGNTFTREDEEAARPVAVISDALWVRKFARDPAAIGRAILLDRQPYTIVGIMPRNFTFPNRGPLMNNIPADVYLPISFTPRERAGFGSMYSNSVIARLKPGVTPTQANADAAALVRANAAEIYPASLSGLAGALTATAVPLQDEVVGRSRTVLLIAFAAVVFVLLIACADIASLMLTRAVSRRREMAVRAALGAGRWRIVRQLLAESGLMAACGGALGLLLAWWFSRVLINLAPSTFPRASEIAIDGRILAFSAGVSLLAALLCGVLPALELSRPDARDALKEEGRTGTAGRRQRVIFNALVTSQVALAVMLLVGGGLLVRSLDRLLSVDPGFRAERVLTFGTSLPVAGYPAGPDVRTFYTRLLDALDNMPGVSAAGASTDLPLSVREHRAFTIEQESAATRELSHAVASQWVLGRYFEALGIPLKRGRGFTREDSTNSEPVVIINETMARRFWRDLDPIGQRMAWGGPAQHSRWMRVVGVVGDVKQSALNVDTMVQVYVPWLQVSDGSLAENIVGMWRSLKLAIRTDMEPEAIVSSARQQVRALDPALPVTAVQTMDDLLRTSTATQRFNTTLLGSFALLALLLAAIGIGGVLATSVSRRTQEIGIRLALGAPRWTVLRMVVRQGMLPALLGLAAGLFVSIRLFTQVMQTLLFEVTPLDPMTFVGVGVLLISVALMACLIPAWRATRVDPMVALRRD